MKHSFKYIISAVFFLYLYTTLSAQNFNYTLSKDSSAYTELTNATIVCTGEKCTEVLNSVNSPFAFNFCGINSNTLEIENSGFVYFDSIKAVALIGFGKFGIRKDATNKFATILSYLVDGNEGNRILKIEFKNLAEINHSATDYLNYQLWIFENGSTIEYHVGPNYKSYFKTFATEEEKMATDFSAMIGISNIHSDNKEKGYFISGNASTPIGKKVEASGAIPLLNDFPSSGTVYRLTPLFK